MIIYPIDNKEYGLNTDWYFSKKEDGISFFINPWDYFSTVGNCLDSINMLQKYGINYEIIIGMTNYASDRVLSETEHRVFSSKQHYPIKIVQYPFYTSRPGMEMLCTPIGSIHSTIWLLNYLLFQTNYSTVFRFDADLLLNIQFIEERRRDRPGV